MNVQTLVTGGGDLTLVEVPSPATFFREDFEDRVVECASSRRCLRTLTRLPIYI